MGSDGEASREKDIPLCEWCSIRELPEAEMSGSGRVLARAHSSLPLGGVRWVKGSQEVENEVIESQGIPVNPQERCPKLEALSAADPTSHFQAWRSHWQGVVAILTRCLNTA